MEIKPYEKNAKKHPKSQLEALAKIVKEVGWRQNVLVNSEGVIIAGHGRYSAWLEFKDKLQLPEIWVINDKGETIMGQCAKTPLTEQQEKMYRLADFNSKHGKIKNDKMNEKDGDEFLDKINNVIKEKTLGAFYITFYRLGIDKYYRSMSRVGLDCRALIIWAKGNHTLSNSDYKSMYEPMFYGWVEKHNFYGGKSGMDIWEIKRTQKNTLHPTMKPVELVEKAILDGSQREETVLDLFGGSGTTIIACEKTGRKARIVELEPKYIDVIIQRWEDYTKQKAKLIKNIYEEQTSRLKEKQN